MNAIMAALRSGMAPGVVHSMVDVAATALRLTGPAPASAPTPTHASTHASPAPKQTLSADALHPPAGQPEPGAPKPSVSSPRHPASHAKRGAESASKLVLRASAGKEPAAQHEADRAGAEKPGTAELPVMSDAPYRYRNTDLLLLQLSYLPWYDSDPTCQSILGCCGVCENAHSMSSLSGPHRSPHLSLAQSTSHFGDIWIELTTSLLFLQLQTAQAHGSAAPAPCRPSPALLFCSPACCWSVSHRRTTYKDQAIIILNSQRSQGSCCSTS